MQTSGRLRLGFVEGQSERVQDEPFSEVWHGDEHLPAQTLRDAHFAQQRTGAVQDVKLSQQNTQLSANSYNAMRSRDAGKTNSAQTALNGGEEELYHSTEAPGLADSQPTAGAHLPTAAAERYGLTETAAPPPAGQESEERRLGESQHLTNSHASIGDEEQNNLTEVAAPSPIASEDTSGNWRKEEHLESAHHSRDKPASDSRKKTSEALTQLYTMSYLIFFSLLGTLARVGVQWITFYPGAPIVISNIWANFGGTLVMGFLSEDRKLFMEEWGDQKPNSDKIHRNNDSEQDDRGSQAIRANHNKVKKTIPLFIGLTTGFCGSFTSFSTFMRDIFYALSNKMPSPIAHPSTTTSTTTTVPRNGGYSFEAILAVIILTVTASLGALKLGAHLAIGVDRAMPTLPFVFLRKFLDPLVVFLAIGCWLGAVVMAIVPPDRPGGPESNGSWSKEVWRGEVLFGLVFAPLGCVLRFFLSARLNGLIAGFPLGTFTANILGTAIFGMSFDLQRVPLPVGSKAIAGGGRVGCQVLQGIEDGFCGCLTTVSTWALELTTLRRRHSYMYGAVSVLCGLALVVIIMGSVAWTIGYADPFCAVEVS